jgi:hypothetical protein
MCLRLVDTFRSSGGGVEVQSQLAMGNRRVVDCSVWAVRRAARFRSRIGMRISAMEERHGRCT